MAVVAGVDFADAPSVSTSFFREGFEKRTGRVSFSNTTYEGGRNPGLMVLRKSDVFLKASQAEITQPLTHKISCLAGFQSPEIQLTFSAR